MAEMIFAYLRGRANLKRVMLLIDARRGVMDDRPGGDDASGQVGGVLLPGPDQDRRAEAG